MTCLNPSEPTTLRLNIAICLCDQASSKCKSLHIFVNVLEKDNLKRFSFLFVDVSCSVWIIRLSLLIVILRASWSVAIINNMDAMWCGCNKAVWDFSRHKSSLHVHIPHCLIFHLGVTDRSHILEWFKLLL